MEYILALHIIFIVTWFSGMFYIVRLFIYNTEAGEKEETEKQILRKQFTIMMKRLWYIITLPSAILTLIFGPLVWYTYYNFSLPQWLAIKLVFVFLLYVYFITLHIIFKQQVKGVFKFTSQQLRIWNEISTIFLIAIVMLAVVKQGISVVWGLIGLVLFIVVLMSAVKIYKLLRKN
ncbi:CopD family protein [Ferruginibacter albus]|uniref:CopD family protein n=1 Tax=Ferruginibacter albus TaxID=2875540 RepID=UPI001CC68742|nr:CopD family protein [Ferruginibacter albus]UAY51622.1 CopD family protein [Ferruginibacter albus]